jgi:hypothetical protein
MRLGEVTIGNKVLGFTESIRVSRVCFLDFAAQSTIFTCAPSCATSISRLCDESWRGTVLISADAYQSGNRNPE